MRRFRGLGVVHAPVIAAWLFAVVYSFPGYMSWDSSEQLLQARERLLGDWHPPIMAAYWSLTDSIVPGPAPLLLLQLTLFAWALYAAYRRRLSERAAAIAAALTLVLPPVLTPMAVVWKDAQMAGFLLAGTMLVLRPGRTARVAGVVVLLLGTGVRDNAAAALPPLLVVIAAAWGVRRRLLAAAAFTLVLAATAMLANRALTQKPYHPWYRTIAIHDIAGTICHAGPLSDDDVREAVPGVSLAVDHDLQHAICARYNPRVWFDLSLGDGALFDAHSAKPERQARRAAWWRLVRAHPGAWLAHRWAVMREVLGLTDNAPWEPVCQTMTGGPQQAARLHYDRVPSRLQERMGAAFRALGRTLLYRPWAYVVLCMLLLGWSARTRDGWVAALAASGLLYETSYMVGAAAPDFRYSHWMVTCCCIALTTIAVERFRQGTRRPTADSDIAPR